MWSVIGLVLDGIGALSLTFGLFGPPVAHGFGGTLPTPEAQAAKARAYGVVGGSFLALGFLLQVVGNISEWSPSAAAKIVGAVASAAVGVPVAMLVFRTAHARFLMKLSQ